MRDAIYGRKFWLVWRKSGSIPRYEHDSLHSAEKEAERLAVLNPGECFIVLESVAEARKNDVQWTRHEDSIPF